MEEEQYQVITIVNLELIKMITVQAYCKNGVTKYINSLKNIHEARKFCVTQNLRFSGVGADGAELWQRDSIGVL